MSPNNIILYTSGIVLVLKKKNVFKSLFKKISGYSKVKVTENKLYLA